MVGYFWLLTTNEMCIAKHLNITNMRLDPVPVTPVAEFPTVPVFTCQPT